MVLSRRDQTIVGVDTTGAQRDLRVRALRGDSTDPAGRWVDAHLADVLGVPEALLEKDRDRDLVLRAIEQAKVRCSQTGTEIPVEIPSVDKPIVMDLEQRSYRRPMLWRGELQPVFESLCERLYENQTSSEDAKRKSEARLRERRVNEPRDAYRLIDVVLLAGGTSLLPGFQEAMLTALFPGGHRPSVLQVGPSFAIAAAAGWSCPHSPHNDDPPRLRALDSEGGDVFQPPLESTLPYPVLLGIKQSPNPEQQVMVLDPNDPFIDDGGRRPIQDVPALAKGSQPKMRLVPGSMVGGSGAAGAPLSSPARPPVAWQDGD